MADFKYIIAEQLEIQLRQIPSWHVGVGSVPCSIAELVPHASYSSDTHYKTPNSNINPKFSHYTVYRTSEHFLSQPGPAELFVKVYQLVY